MKPRSKRLAGAATALTMAVGGANPGLLAIPAAALLTTACAQTNPCAAKAKPAEGNPRAATNPCAAKTPGADVNPCTARK